MLKDEIQKEMIGALKAGNKIEVMVLRYVLSEIKYAEIAKQKDLTDEEVVAVIQKEVKKRTEAIAMFEKNNRMEMVEDEKNQLVIISRYVPKQFTSDELDTIIDEVFSTLGPNVQMGQVMGLVMGKVKGRADGKTISDLIRRKLASK